MWGTRTKAYQWSYFVRTPGVELVKKPNAVDPGFVFQLRGAPGFFHYTGPQEVDMSTFIQGLKVCEIKVGEVKVRGDVHDFMDRLGDILGRTPVLDSELQGESSWNCQSWALQAYDILARETSIVELKMTKEDIRAQLETEPGRIF